MITVDCQSASPQGFCSTRPSRLLLFSREQAIYKYTLFHVACTRNPIASLSLLTGLFSAVTIIRLYSFPSYSERKALRPRDGPELP
ncbi:hypothetical protein GQ53DRAFT_745730 [Thozetella sp. PMI_491]|nr:hypothetical protein GQ53DRAFT_745730 [Thozetella sp. PMI_491]